MARLEIIPLPSDRRVQQGDDLAELLVAAATAAGTDLADGDVVCVASKVVSKAEGATVDLPQPDDVHAARRVLTAGQASRVVAETPWVLVVETHHGFVCANAGIDTSNVADGRALLLPADPDAAATGLRAAIRARTGADVGVVITDTFGRPWRMGQTDVALGAAGIVALRDERGGRDLEGNTLEVTMVAVADELAAAADLARRKADGTPFVLVRGAAVAGDGRGRDLVRDASEDVFRTGGPTTIEAALLSPQPVPWHGGVEGAWTLAERAVVATAGPTFGTGDAVADARPLVGQARDLSDDPPPGVRGAVVLGLYGHEDPASQRWVGTARERARLLLQAHGLVTAWREDVPAVAPRRHGRPVPRTDGRADIDLDGRTDHLRLVGVLTADRPAAGNA